MNVKNKLIQSSKIMNILKYEKMLEEILTNRYIKIIEENRLLFFRYKECCKEAALKEMEKKNDKNKNVEVRNKSR